MEVCNRDTRTYPPRLRGGRKGGNRHTTGLSMEHLCGHAPPQPPPQAGWVFLGGSLQHNRWSWL